MLPDLCWPDLPGYRARLVRLPGGFYWHLYRQGGRINGGMNENQVHAARSPRYAAVWDEMSLFRSRF